MWPERTLVLVESCFGDECIISIRTRYILFVCSGILQFYECRSSEFVLSKYKCSKYLRMINCRVWNESRLGTASSFVEYHPIRVSINFARSRKHNVALFLNKRIVIDNAIWISRPSVRDIAHEFVENALKSIKFVLLINPPNTFLSVVSKWRFGRFREIANGINRLLEGYTQSWHWSYLSVDENIPVGVSRVHK